MAIKKRLFTYNTLEEFMYPVQEESWDKVLVSDYVNISFKAFMNTFMFYFNTAFLIKTSYVTQQQQQKRVIMGLIVSRIRM
jgi:hypothetical protein